MAYWLRASTGFVLLLVGFVARPASAQSADSASGVNRHRVAAELGGFVLAKDDHPPVSRSALATVIGLSSV